MATKVKIEYPDAYSMVIHATKESSLRSLIVGIIIMVVWYGLLSFTLAKNDSPLALTLENTLLWGMTAGLTVYSFARFFRAIKIIMLGERYYFDGLAQVILKDKKQLARFADIHSVQIKKISDSEGPGYYYRASVLLKKGVSLYINEFENYEEMARIVNEISRVTNSPTVTK